MRCTATLNTDIRRPCPHDVNWLNTRHHNRTCLRTDDGWVQVKLLTLSCDVPRDEHYMFVDDVEEHTSLHPIDEYHLRWRDNWVGATPHES